MNNALYVFSWAWGIKSLEEIMINTIFHILWKRLHNHSSMKDFFKNEGQRKLWNQEDLAQVYFYLQWDVPFMPKRKMSNPGDKLIQSSNLWISIYTSLNIINVKVLWCIVERDAETHRFLAKRMCSRYICT